MRPQLTRFALIVIMWQALGTHDAVAGPLVALKATGRANLPLARSTDMVGAARCDASGNVYARPANREGGNADEFLLAPIRQITPEGKMGGTFKLTDAWPEPGVGRGIFVGSGGTVYQAAIADDGVYVVAFAKDGLVKSKTRLQTALTLIRGILWSLSQVGS